MRHKKKFKTLGRNKNGRKAMFRNMCVSLLENGHIVTSEAKGKELRKILEPLIVKAKKTGNLAERRKLISKLGSNARAAELIAVAAKKTSRTSGWLRLSRLPITSGDGSKKVKVEIIE